MNCWEGFCRWCGMELNDLDSETCGLACAEVLAAWSAEWACVPAPTRKEWICSACNVVMSGTQDEHRASIDQRTLVQSIRAHREPQQEELMPDAP